MLGAIALVFHRDGNEVALAFAFAAVAGLVPRLVHARTGRSARAEGRRRDRLARRAGGRDHAGLVLAPWGALPWAIYLLAVTAWFTVGQRVWSVRTQLRARAGDVAVSLLALLC